MNWQDAATQIKAFQSANPGQTKALLITAADVNSLKNQSSTITAMRIYFGQDANGKITGFAIASVDDGSGGYNDYSFPVDLASFTVALNNGTVPTKKDSTPCPTACGTTNYLNS